MSAFKSGMQWSAFFAVQSSRSIHPLVVPAFIWVAVNFVMSVAAVLAWADKPARGSRPAMAFENRIRGNSGQVPKQKANALITKTYEVGSFVIPIAIDRLATVDCYGTSNQLQNYPDDSGLDYDSLIELIEQTISPNSWSSVGGMGTIQPDRKNLTLVILQTESVHDQIAELQAQLWLLQGHQSAIASRKAATLRSATRHEEEAISSTSGMGLTGQLISVVCLLGIAMSYYLARTGSTQAAGRSGVGDQQPTHSLIHRLRVPFLVTLHGAIILVLVLSGWLFWQAWQRHELIRSLAEAVKTADDRAIYRTAARIVTEKLDSEAVVTLVPLLRDGDRNDRILPCRILSVFGPEAEPAVPLLIEMLKDRYSAERYAAAKCLGEIGPSARQAIPQLIKTLEDERMYEMFGHPWVRSFHLTDMPFDGYDPNFAAQALIRIGADAVPPLTDALAEHCVHVRGGAAHLLAQFGSGAHDAVPRLTGLLQDDSKYVRLAAAHALWKIDRQPAPAIREFVNLRVAQDRTVFQSGSDGRVQSKEFFDRMGIDRETVRHTLTDFQQDTDPLTREIAAQALVEYDSSPRFKAGGR